MPTADAGLVGWIVAIWATARQNQQNDMRPAKNQISLGIRPVWSDSSLCALLPSWNKVFIIIIIIIIIKDSYSLVWVLSSTVGVNVKCWVTVSVWASS